MTPLILSEKKANYKKDIENKEANEFDINRNSQRVERHKTKKEDLDGVRLDINDLSDSNNSLFKFEDEKSEYIKSQTFRQNKDLGQIPNEFKQKIYELKKTAMIYDESERCYKY